MKKIETFTKNDWDTTFPIELVPHNPEWKDIYSKEEQKITQQLGHGTIINIEHVGSTSIPHIYSKPYIDISIEISKEDLFDEDIINGMTDLGYHYFRNTENTADYMIFVKGYNLEGQKEQIYHIHACPPAHDMLKQIVFRDLLRANPERAKEYEQLKVRLATKFKNDRSGYRIAKGDFINKTMQMANK